MNSPKHTGWLSWRNGYIPLRGPIAHGEQAVKAAEGASTEVALTDCETVLPGTLYYDGVNPILPKALVNTDVVVERGCIINLGAMIDHGCVIEEGVHICLGGIVKAENRVKTLTKIEAGEVVEARTWPV